jgi:[ribosomal protein S18]-alanine N-acetyltransferase
VRTTGLSIRLATPDDAADIAALSRDEIERGLPWSWTEGRVADSIRNPDTNVAVAGERGGIAGFGIMIYRDEAAHLSLFCVKASHRRQGVGSAILRWLEDVARTGGVRTIRLECRRDNDAARNFYGEHGYHERAIARGYYQGREDAVQLEKFLIPPG